MVENKTSVLPRLCLKFITELTGQDEEMCREVTTFMNALGAAFQIQDDLIAVTSEEYRKERGVYCEDVQEGKRTLMVIHNYFYGWKGDQVVALLDQKSSDEKIHREVIQIFQQEGSIEYATEKARLVMRRAWESIEPKLKDCDAKEDIHDLSKFLMDRKL